MKNDSGNILIMSIVIAALLLASAGGYMQWGSDERWEAAYEQATIQAYFLSQQGVVQQGLKYLRSRKPTEIPYGTVYLLPVSVKDIGMIKYNKVIRSETVGNNAFQRTDSYDIYSTGEAYFINHQLGNKNYGKQVPVQRTTSLRVSLRSFSNYMYLTDMEETRFHETIWFWQYDTLYGRTHSNDWIGISNRPVFYGPVSTCQEDFIHGNGYNPYFAYPPKFSVPKVDFPYEAQTLRAHANPRIDGYGKMTRIWLRGEQGIMIYQYELGSPAPGLYGDNFENVEVIHELPAQSWGGIFVEGQVELYGIVSGRLTVGSSEDMWLVDNIRYIGASEDNGYFGATSEEQKSMPNMLGIVSEKNIIIADNWYNGRENGFNTNRNNLDRHSIIINAGMVALGESFTFEHQNDSWDFYIGSTPDDRGTIHLVGSVTQLRRG